MTVLPYQHLPARAVGTLSAVSVLAIRSLRAIPAWQDYPDMGDKSRQVPHPEWVLMYRRGLTRSRIANLVGAPVSKVGYHLTVARDIYPELVHEHEAAAPRGGDQSQTVTGRGIATMNALINFVTTHGRYPASKAPSQEERALGLWLQRRRRNAAAGTLAPAFRDGLQTLPDWATNTRTLSDESRWNERFAGLAAYRAAGEEWPRHKNAATEEEHTLGVWLHTQRFKLRRGELLQARVETLDTALPGWREGRARGRKPRLNRGAG